MTHPEIPDRPMLWFSRAGLMEVDRRAVEDFGIAVPVLMENAGRQVAEVTRSYMMEGSAVLKLKLYIMIYLSPNISANPRFMFSGRI